MASKSAQQEHATAEDIEEALDTLDTTLDRLKVLYEQYFLGIQKQPPQFIHADVERKLRDLAQLQIRNTALRYRFATLQQKFGSYNTYWRRTLREIEAGRYHRNLSKIGRHAAATGAEIPQEILAAMPKRMREQVRRDREAQLALQRRREGAAPGDDAELLTLVPLDDEDGAGFVRETTAVREQLRAGGGMHVLDEADADLDLEAYFRAVEAEASAGAGGEDDDEDQTVLVLGSAAPVASPVPAPAAALPQPAAAPPQPAAVDPPRGPRPLAQGSPPPPLSPTVRAASIGAPVRARSPTLGAARASANRPSTDPPAAAVAGGEGALHPESRTTPARPSATLDTQPGIGPVRAITRPPTGQPVAEPAPAPRAPPSAAPPDPAAWQTEPEPAAPPSRPSRPPSSPSMTRPPPVGSRAPEPKPPPPPGMTEADVNALYVKYVKAKEMVGEEAGPGSFGKLLKTINAQAPKIMEQYRAKGVDFTVVVKDNQVIIRAKPKL